MNLKAIGKKIVAINEKIVELGVEGQEISFRRTVIRTINLMAIINIAICLISNLIIYVTTDIKTVLIPSLSETVLFAFVLLLNKRHLYDQAAFIMYLTHCMSVVYFGLKFGKNADAGILTLYLLVAAYLVFKTNTFRLIGMAMSVVSIVILELNYHFHYIPEWQLSVANINFIRWMIYGSVATLSGSLMYFFIQRNAQQARLNEMEIASKTEKYQRAEQAKQDLLNEVTHEISNPAHIVLQVTENCIQRVKNIEVDKVEISLEELWTLRTASNVIGDQCSTILTWAQGERMKERENKRDVIDLNSWATNLIRMYDGKARQRKLGLTLNISKETPQYIVTDRVRFNHIVTNLIVNAIKFAYENTDIVLHIHHVDLTLVASVTDCGPGIAKENQSKVFEPYYTSGKIAAGIESTGVGLALVKKLVELLKGSIALQSQEGIGSKFTVSIPLVLPTDAELHTLFHFSDYRFNGEKILTVDDQLMFETVTRLILKRFGCQHFHVSTSVDAIKVAFEVLPDVILLDLRLPSGFTFSVIDVLKADERTAAIPIIIMSSGSVDEIKKAFESGASAYLPKPFKESELKQMLATFIPLVPVS